MESHQRGLFIMYKYMCTYVQYMYLPYIYIYVHICISITCIVILIVSLGAGFNHFVFSPLFGEIVNHQLVTSTVDGLELLHHPGCIKPWKWCDIYHTNWWSPDFWTINSSSIIPQYNLKLPAAFFFPSKLVQPRMAPLKELSLVKPPDTWKWS